MSIKLVKGDRMAKFIIAKQLAGKKIITNEGEDIGKLIDLYINELSGRIESLLVEPNLDNATARAMRKEDGLLAVPLKVHPPTGSGNEENGRCHDRRSPPPPCRKEPRADRHLALRPIKPAHDASDKI